MSRHRSTQKKQQEGFTILEVLVGIIMATIFVLITSQAIAISAVFRTRAQREAEAVAWIQEDLENVKFKSLQALTGSCDATTATGGFANALAQAINGANVPTSNTTTKPLLKKSYSMTRTLNAFNLAPFNLMTVNYSVSDPVSGKVIANLYTEVIPDAAFDCD